MGTILQLGKNAPAERPVTARTGPKPPVRYEVLRGPDGIKVLDRERDYFLVLSRKSHHYLGAVHFFRPGLTRDGHVFSHIPVTATWLRGYPAEVRKLKITPGLQYLEVGAGYGGFIPRVLLGSRQGSPRPIIIDSADFDAMHGLLSYAKAHIRLPDRISGIVDKILERHGLITDPGRVRLLNMNLGDALCGFPDLAGIADVLVDRCGAVSYPELEARDGDRLLRDFVQRVAELERRLLKQGGKIFTLGRC
jgi:hypothetical protein